MFEWLSWVSSTWFGIEAFSLGLTLPGPRREAWLSPQVLDVWPMAKEIVAILDDSEAAQISWNLRDQEIDLAFNATSGELWVGDLTPQQCGEKVTGEIDAVLGKSML